MSWLLIMEGNRNTGLRSTEFKSSLIAEVESIVDEARKSLTSESTTNSVVLPYIPSYGSLWPLASTVIRVRGIVSVVSSIVLFLNHRQCLRERCRKTTGYSQMADNPSYSDHFQKGIGFDEQMKASFSFGQDQNLMRLLKNLLRFVVFPELTLTGKFLVLAGRWEGFYNK